MRAVAVRLQHGAGRRFDHAVREELHGRRGQTTGCAISDQIARRHEVVELVAPRVRVAPQGQVSAERENSGIGGCQPQADVVRLDPRVLDPGEAGRDEVRCRQAERRQSLVDRHGRHEVVDGPPRAPLPQRAGRLSIRTHDDLAVMRLGSPAGVANAPQRLRVEPDRVVVGRPKHDRPVRHLGIEPFGEEHAIRGERVVEALPADPLHVAMLVRPRADGGGDPLRRRGGSHRGEGQFEPPRNAVHVPVPESGCHEAAAGVDDHIRAPPTGRLAQGQDAVRLEGDRVRDQDRAVDL